MRRLPQSVAYTAVFKLFLSSDHITAATGKTVAITISKAGAAFANPNAGASNATEISGGWYKFALDTTDTSTLGDLVLVGTATACDTADIVMYVVSATTGGASNLDGTVSTRASQTSVDAVDDFLDTEIAAIKAKTDLIPASPAATGDAMTLTAAYDFAMGSVAMTEAYAADGATPTPVQALYLIQQMLADFAIVSTTLTVRKLDGVATAATFTLDSATTPTAKTRAT